MNSKTTVLLLHLEEYTNFDIEFLFKLLIALQNSRNKVCIASMHFTRHKCGICPAFASCITMIKLIFLRFSSATQGDTTTSRKIHRNAEVSARFFMREFKFSFVDIRYVE